MYSFYFLFDQDCIFISSDTPPLHQSHLLLHFIILRLQLVTNAGLSLTVTPLKGYKDFFVTDIPMKKINKPNFCVPLSA
jgi:hypothetical protein